VKPNSDRLCVRRTIKGSLETMVVHYYKRQPNQQAARRQHNRRTNASPCSAALWGSRCCHSTPHEKGCPACCLPSCRRCSNAEFSPSTDLQSLLNPYNLSMAFVLHVVGW
jgi:hypothetical protein